MSHPAGDLPSARADPAARENASVVGALAARALEIRAGPLGEQLEEAARRAFVDWLGVTLGGSLGVPATALVAGLELDGGPSRLIGRRQTAPVSVAALINGTSAHTLELDDIYAPGLFHPGAPVIAAALAAADARDVTLSALWRAITTGYEVGGRVAADLGPAHYAHWHTTGTAGAIGAAAAVAEIRCADAARFGHALALAATMAGGLQQTFRRDAMGKPLHAGAAAQAGVVAAAAAMGGVTGADDVLEGPAGLAAATGSVTSWAHSRGGLTRPFAIEAVTVKPYACCGHAFAAIDAALRLRSQGVHGADVSQVQVQTYPTALEVAGIVRPRTEAERKFSIAHLVAVALVLGPAGMRRDGLAADATAAEPEVGRIAGCMQLTADPVFGSRFPQRRGARVIVVTRDGARQTAEVPDRSGSPENPLTVAQVEDKFLAAWAPLAGQAAGRDLLDRLSRGGGMPVRALDLAPLVPRADSAARADAKALSVRSCAQPQRG
jgi:2-methylcitrate dehydratase PrpD